MKDFAPLPLDFVAVRAAGGDIDVCHFESGRATAAARPGARLVLHAGLDAESLRAWQASGVLCIGGERALALFAPEESAPVTTARALGERYARAAAQIAAESETLRVAAHLLPAEDAALRSLLHRSLGELALRTLGARPAAPPAVHELPDARVTTSADAPRFDWSHRSPHDLLDAAFRHLYAWRRATGALPFEPRPEQLEMSHAVLEAWESGKDLVVEAGTGVGKTLAYALPALLLAATRGLRIVLSTHTRNLQHQLVARDLPELWAAFDLDRRPRPGGGTGLAFAKLLGRENYVCRAALARVARAAAIEGGDFDLARLLLWSLRSRSGELVEIAPFLSPQRRREIASRRESCRGAPCRGDDPCPVHVARDAARRADLVVVNHALLFSDALAEGGILGRADALVVDEAHHLDAVATEHLSIRLGRATAEALVAPLGRLPSATGDDSAARATPAARAAGIAAAAPRWLAWTRQVASARAELLAWLEAVRALVPTPMGGKSRQRYRDGDEVFGGLRDETARCRQALDAARALADELRDESTPAGESAPADDAADVVALVGTLLGETRAALDFLCAGDNEDWAFAVGLDGAGVHEILASPLDVAPALRRLLGARAGTVYTSATLAADGSLESFVARVGLPSATAQRLVSSPFDYAVQSLAVLAHHLPEHDDPGFAAAAADLLVQVSRRTGRRTLVLLTSHAAVRRLYAEIVRRVGPRASVFAQEISGSREVVAARFAAAPGAILLGTASFWEGVDFPGDALEVLAIGKLPFAVPDDPLVEARCERLKARGENPFASYLLPDAVLRFRQGFGRLVRTRHDRGVVLLLDPRLGDRHYGEVFLRALPVEPEVFLETGALVERVAAWLAMNAPAAADRAPRV